MSSSIRFEDVHDGLPRPVEEPVTRAVLHGEIDGLRTVFHALPPGAVLQPSTSADEGRVFLFTSGCGRVEDSTAVFEIAEVAIYAPRHETPFTVTATASTLLLLELVVDLSATDRAELEANAARYPLFLSYSDCPTYRERIKSDKTVSRTLLAEHTFPRLCIGSVQTTGDDRVAEHQHPMLEQLFFGLDDNHCILRADAAEMEFGEGVLLHIPLGSTHGVEVHAPHRLHYIWIDLFSDREGMEWIVQEHVPNA
jgi:hypothetical protein